MLQRGSDIVHRQMRERDRAHQLEKENARLRQLLEEAASVLKYASSHMESNYNRVERMAAKIREVLK